jgi:phospholipid/cholesterol/gamma-HCH transport system substrate-binding protein
VNKQAPSFGRILTMVLFAMSCFGLLLFLWLAFGGSIPLKPTGYQFTIPFPNATQLADEADVRISGVPVGKVKNVTLGKNNQNDALIEMDTRFAPIPSDVRAILRQKTLLGQTRLRGAPNGAPTPGSKTAPKLKENGRLNPAQVQQGVELDEIFRAFDDKTRRGFQVWQQSLAEAVARRGGDISNALATLEPFANDTNDLLKILKSQEGAVQRLVRNGGVVFGALSERDGQLRSLIENSNQVFATTARRNRELADTFRILPTFERESRATLARLDTFAANANPLVNQLRPAARQLSPTLTDLSALAPDLKAFFRDLNPLINASRLGVPAATKVLQDLTPLLSQLDPALRELIPLTDFVGMYQREILGFFANTVAATGATDRPTGANVPIHYLRTTNPLNPEVLAAYPNRIGTSRNNPYVLPGGFTKIGRPSLDSYDIVHCGAGGIPFIGGLISSIIPTELDGLIREFVFGNAASPVSPPCNKQAQYTNRDGSKTDYPHVTAIPPGG